MIQLRNNRIVVKINNTIVRFCLYLGLRAIFAKFSWRREGDSNPRNHCWLNGFQDRRFRPLSHPSEGEDSEKWIMKKGKQRKISVMLPASLIGLHFSAAFLSGIPEKPRNLAGYLYSLFQKSAVLQTVLLYLQTESA